MGLRGDYGELWRGTKVQMLQQVQEASKRARELWLAGKYSNAVYLVGYNRWMAEALVGFTELGNQYEASPGIIPYTDTKDYRTRRNEMKSIATSIAERIFTDAYCPLTTGEGSPVFEYWNKGKVVPAIYMAGRWKACEWFWNFFVWNFGWSDRADRDKIPDADRIVPFPGNVVGDVYPKG